MNDKFLFRNYMKKHGLLNMAFQGGKHWKDFENWNRFPAILKPVRSQGQRGIRKIDCKEDIQKHIRDAQQYTESGEVIVEEFISGSEVSVNIFLKEGRILYSFISDRMVYEGLEGGLVKAHIFPTRMKTDLQERALQLISDTVEHLKIQNGPMYFQMMHNDTDVYIIEGTPRLDGCHIWRLIRSYAGVDLLKLTFDQLFGKNIQPERVSPNGNIQGLYFLSQEPQLTFECGDFEVPEGCRYHEYYYEDGEKVRPLNRIFEKVGYYIK